MKKKPDGRRISLKVPLLYFLYLFIGWSIYRIGFKFSDSLEELYIKPIIWLLPFLYLIPKEKLKIADLGITVKNFFPSIYLSLALGVGFAFLGIIANMAKYGGIDFGANIGSGFFATALFISFATSVTEEFVFRGYLLGRLMRKFDEWMSVALATVLWTAIHVPIIFFVWGISGMQIAVYLGLTFIYGLGASVVFVRTKNLVAPTLLHVLWEWPVILFR
ncbi:MAG: hypothetical protein UT39_C0002G0029 [Candidatus Woesebacteria bacterium GW2011_GWA1_39_21]|uniref:CAAX prenyl protease 2/Lysostaphin resistance protein A-like domain-containing protein n=1 Tax=Candidatus Woesebacteria bacterium GW2011_GWA1_39_21 TaxID=1618550 RepID=A0A0G0N8S5_9BACT|nr:MAG: hypothetical protein UT39_C0002G0029 [Candidatus Woesebacteria bacterium GW2011_GWA1_39_21]